jgi:hypothetical protein
MTSAVYAGGGEALKPFKFETDAETFKILIESGGIEESASESTPAKKTANFIKSENACKWD